MTRRRRLLIIAVLAVLGGLIDAVPMMLYPLVRDYDSRIASWILTASGGLSAIALTIVSLVCYELLFSRGDSFLDIRRETRRAARTGVKEILDSNEFLSVLRTVLPKGEADPAYGFDYIPYMLHSIDERRLRFRRSSQAFLILTVTLGLIFSVLLTYFAFLIINEAAAGPARDLVRLEEAARALDEDAAFVPAELARSRVFAERVRPALDAVRTADHGTSGVDTGELASAISEAINRSDLLTLEYKLNATRNAITGTGVVEKNYAQLLRTAELAVRDFRGDGQHAEYRLGEEVRELDSAITDAKANLDKPENRTAELLKRLTLALIVSSFLFAVLRYVAGLYKEHYKQVLAAEADDFAVRRFYVTFKCSEGAQGAREKVIGTFAACGAAAPSDTQLVQDDPSTPEIVKELLSLISKKV
jgi:hypothetical protein